MNRREGSPEYFCGIFRWCGNTHLDPWKQIYQKWYISPGLFWVGVQTRNCAVFGQGVVLLTERMNTVMSNIRMLLHQVKNVCSDIAQCTTIYFTVDFILSVCMCICMVEWMTYVGVHHGMARRSGNKLWSWLSFSSHFYIGSWDWNEAVKFLWQTPLPMELPCWPLV